MRRVQMAVGMLLAAALLAGCAAPAAPPTPTAAPRTYPLLAAGISTGQHPHTSQAGDVNYLLYLPADYGRQADKTWPLMLFLHGSGERGYDLQMLTAQPLPETLEKQSDFPFIVVSPQLEPTAETWAGMVEPLDTLLGELERSLRVDPRRVYLTGLSLGGEGTWLMALGHPERFAALAPMAGFYRGDPQDLCALKSIPAWVFHGGQDQSVRPSASQGIVAALEACGGDVRFTFYPEADHIGSWRQAYAEPELYTWLLAQQRK